MAVAEELPDFIVIQLPYTNPDDTLDQTLRDLSANVEQENRMRPVGVITSFAGQALYVIFEKPTEEK